MVNTVIGALLEGLFPQRCLLCELHSHRPRPLCRACEGDLVANSYCCEVCALPLAPASDARVCGACLSQPPAFDRVIAPWLYEERLAHLVGQWKFHGQHRLAKTLAQLWLEQTGGLPEADLVTAVPLHWRRLLQRGYNQAELLQDSLLRDAGPAGPTSQPRLLRRVRATPAQSGLGATARHANLRRAFTVRGRCDNLRVAVVDDVLTTGSTANAVARVLKDAGAESVQIWCLARTPAPA